MNLPFLKLAGNLLSGCKRLKIFSVKNRKMCNMSQRTGWRVRVLVNITPDVARSVSLALIDRKFVFGFEWHCRSSGVMFPTTLRQCLP
jgi:hypothetical protein